MDSLAGGDVYQLWFKDGSDVEPAAAFTVDASGSANAEVGDVPDGTDEVLVTQESEPDLPAPEGDVLLSASLS
jgi:hypothetical protein